MSGAAFISEAAAQYERINADNLSWALERPRLAGGFLNTKQNSITLKDYGPEDGLRGPDYIYGWLIGRGLEALVTHAAFFDGRDDALAHAAWTAAHETYRSLAELQAETGHAYFCYGPGFRPIYAADDQNLHSQNQPDRIYTCTDAFAAKGLVAAAARLDPPALEGHVAYLMRVIDAIEDERFQLAERAPLCDEAIDRQPADFGPFMLMVGAAELLVRVGKSDAAEAFAPRFIRHVLDRHLDPASGLLRTTEGGDGCNAGHGIEFVGFALAWLPRDADPALIDTLERILIASFRAAFSGPGIVLEVSIASGAVRDHHCPWWSLPEAIRAAALLFERTGSKAALAVWRDAHDAFMRYYWRPEARIAYQTKTPDGPVDFVPATPDLDSGYHTGLSLLAAIQVAGRLTGAPDDPAQKTG